MTEYEPTEEELDRYVLNKKEEAGIRYKLEKKAFHECFYLTERYAECVKGRFLSVLVCRDDLKKLETCLSEVSAEDNFEDLRREFIREQLILRKKEQSQLDSE